MRYILALICPPITMWVSGKPKQSFAATFLMISSLLSGSIVIIVLGFAASMLWACRVAGDFYAQRELEGFLELMKSSKS